MTTLDSLNIPLKQALIGTGRSNGDIAREAGLSQSQLSQLVHGYGSVNTEKRAKLAKMLNVEENVVFPDDKMDPPPWWEN